MNRKSFSQLAKVKGARTPDGQVGSPAIKGTGSGGKIPVGTGTNPRPRGGASSPLGATRIDG
jgi:hypothetical protein